MVARVPVMTRPELTGLVEDYSPYYDTTKDNRARVPGLIQLKITGLVGG